ncbi:ACT domain-containing protein [Roseicyclus marinus]|uniref:ACT domain-containing protein n=1 Tax=Roseicyclus marinus TaxID=2161673 RepID=UPI00240F041F|nr:ACT domain-containing protein [Roseicyclus marinus]MDG3042116.1 ACT domain-containing protein [Roseicyclus marinus]
MPDLARTAAEMIGGMDPVLWQGAYRFFSTTDRAEAERLRVEAVASFEEEEGISLIVLAADDAADAMRRITLRVHSALDGVGLTAAVSGALARNGIACNMVAAFHHDHVFVPAARAEEAMEILRALQARGG